MRSGTCFASSGGICSHTLTLCRTGKLIQATACTTHGGIVDLVWSPSPQENQDISKDAKHA